MNKIVRQGKIAEYEPSDMHLDIEFLALIIKCELRVERGN